MSNNQEVFHQLLRHVTVGVVRRLAGLNRSMNSLLMNEHFWKENCVREFGAHMIPDGGPLFSDLLDDND